jgi:heptaprenyl diphosphate synthase
MIGDLERVEAALREAVASDLELLGQIAGHLVDAGGKRVRPGFAIASAATSFEPPQCVPNEVVAGAVAVELVHIGSLYHDDVMDGADVRRGVPSVNAAWGNHRAILAGDFLLARASEIAASLGTEVAGLLASTIARLCDGQIRELEATGDLDRTAEAYEASIAGKTASLLSTACRIGGITGDLSRDHIDAVTDFGEAYGFAFQIVDDILDLTATEQQLGKPAGNDLIEGVFTLPVIIALDGADGSELRDLLASPLDAVAHQRAIEIVRAGDGVDIARGRAQAWADKAAAPLTALPPTDATRALQTAAAHLVERANGVRDTG